MKNKFMDIIQKDIAINLNSDSILSVAKKVSFVFVWHKVDSVFMRYFFMRFRKI